MGADIGYMQGKVRDLNEKLETIEKNTQDLDLKIQHMQKLKSEAETILVEIKAVQKEIERTSPATIETEIKKSLNGEFSDTLIPKLVSSQVKTVQKDLADQLSSVSTELRKVISETVNRDMTVAVNMAIAPLVEVLRMNGALKDKDMAMLGAVGALKEEADKLYGQYKGNFKKFMKKGDDSMKQVAEDMQDAILKESEVKNSED